MFPALPYPTFFVGSSTQTEGTAITALIPPNRGAAGPPLLYQVDGQGQPNWIKGQGASKTHITRLQYTSGATAHTLTLFRPQNWTTFAAQVAKNTTSITLSDDPGVFSTNYRYPLPAQPGGAASWKVNPPGTANAVGPSVADDAIASGDYVAYQLSDGTWRLDTVASGTFAGANLVLTTGTPNVTGAVILKNSPLFLFGTTGDNDPATGTTHPTLPTIASTNDQNWDDGGVLGLFSTLHYGDPCFLLSNNATNAGTLEFISGFYASH